jgi:hypothetical protein
MPNAWLKKLSSLRQQGGFMKNRWQKTTIAWGCSLGLETNMPVTDWHNPEEKHLHTIHKIEATSLPDRKGQIELRIQRLLVSPTTERERIRTMLSEGLWNKRKKLFRMSSDDSIRVKNENDYSGLYIIEFYLDNGDSFCDIVIGIVREVFSILGVEDESGFKLASFSIKQETFISFEEAWISFASWLRIHHRLPVYCSANIT